MYRNIQQETWKVWYMTTEKDLTVLAKYPLLPGQSFKTRWVAIGISDRGKANASLNCRTGPSSVGDSQKRIALSNSRWPRVFFYPPFLGTLKFPAVVGNNGLLVKT